MVQAISLGPLLLPIVPLAVMLALLTAIWFVSRTARAAALDAAWSARVAEHSVLIGLAGARLGFVALYWSAYRAAPWTAFYLWQPGYLWWTGVGAAAAYATWRIGRRALLERLRYLAVLGVGFAAGALLLGTLLGAALLLAEPDTLRRGDAVPDFSLRALDGELVRFSRLEGDIVVLNFWAIWCPPCRREMPLLDAVGKAYASRGVRIIGIDVGEDARTVAAYTRSIGIEYPIWLDAAPGAAPSGPQASVYERFGGIGFPTTVFIDHRGVIRDVHVGELSRGLLESRIEYLLAQRTRFGSGG